MPCEDSSKSDAPCRCGHRAHDHGKKESWCLHYSCPCRAYIPQRAPEEPGEGECDETFPDPCEEGGAGPEGYPNAAKRRDDLWQRIRDEVYEYREKTCLWGETDGITEAIADMARRAVKAPPAPSRRPPYAVAYAVQGGAQYEVLVPGDATVVAEDGVLKISHGLPGFGIDPVLGVTYVRPVETGPAQKGEG